MTIYLNSHRDNPIRSVEFLSCVQGNVSFFHVTNPAQKEAVKQLLSLPGIGQKIIAETEVNGAPVLMTEGDKTRAQLLSALNAQGNTLKEEVIKKKFNPWAWRGITSIVGQSLQLFSGFKSSGSPADRAALIGFASSNLLANGTNILFGAQKKDDPHQLRLLKDQFNKKFEKYLPAGESLPSPDEQRLSLRADETQQSTQDKTKNFIKRHSVSGGEIGLRFLGATSLAYPVTRWKGAYTGLKNGEKFGEAFKSARNTNLVTYNVGLITLLGKVVSLCSKEPDPYNPRKHTWLDAVREKVTFRLSSVIEGAGAAWMAYDRFANQKIKLFGKETRDYVGGVGNLVFIGGYVIRYFASYGSKEVDMKELNAHISDSLARMPRDKLPQLVMEAATDLKKHFKDKPLEISQLYADIAADLKKHYQIDVLPAPLQESDQTKQAEGRGKPQRIWAAGSPADNHLDRVILADTASTISAPAM